MRKLTILIPILAAAAALPLSGCGDHGPDMRPVGNGLTMIGVGLVLAALVACVSDHFPDNK